VKFSPIPSKTMTVILTGPGAYKGKVTGKVVKSAYSPMISCGSGCTTETETFFVNGETELAATAATGYSFKGWTVSGGSAGTCTGTTTPCKLLTDANKTVEAEFK
jgi:List-Bact-rpt repeat protein